jgi:TetR/AcrR family transcriptional repressor of nem operon
LEFQIARAEAGGLPGSGCLFVNTMTEVEPHDASVEALTMAHSRRLKGGFTGALRAAAKDQVDPVLIDNLAAVLIVGAHGLWSLSRLTADAAMLHGTAAALVELVQRRLET